MISISPVRSVIRSFFFSDEQLQFLLERCLLVLLEPRTFSLYDLFCSILAAIVTIMKNRKLYAIPFACKQ